MKRIAIFVLALAAVAPVFAGGPKYDTMDGCDDARWKEWESIIIGFEGYPEEQEDARSVREANRKACAAWKAGKVTAEQATEGYDREVDAWTKRIERRQEQRKSRGASTGQG